MKYKDICCFCHLIKSLVEEASKHPVGTQWAHRECYQKALQNIGNRR